MNSLVQKTIAVLPVVSFIIYLLGFTYYIFYYAQFGVDIIYYISLSDILVATLIIVISFSYLIILFYLLIFQASINRSAIFRSLRRKLKKQYKNNMTVNKMFAYIILMFVILLSFNQICFLLYSTNSLWANILIFIIIIIYILLFFSYTQYFKIVLKPYLYNYFKYLNLIFIVINAILFMVGLGESRAVRKYVSEETKNIEIHLSDTIYSTITDNNLLFLGETTSTYFLFKKLSKETLIIDKGNVSRTIIVKKGRHPIF